jgi:hypothetical protein
LNFKANYSIGEDGSEWDDDRMVGIAPPPLIPFPPLATKPADLKKQYDENLTRLAYVQRQESEYALKNHNLRQLVKEIRQKCIDLFIQGQCLNNSRILRRSPIISS